MKGNWIPWAKGLPKKAKVMRIAKQLDMSIWEAACRCMAVWEWADEHTADGYLPGMCASSVDDVAGVFGFADAMMAVGWLSQEAEGVTLPNWHEYNVSSTKLRMQARERKRLQRHREKDAKSP